MSKNTEEYRRLALKVHALWAEGRQGTDEADEVVEAMQIAWEQLTPEERDVERVLATQRISNSEAKKIRISITVDCNDADYNTEVSVITEEELEQLKPLIAAIKAFQPYTTKTRDGERDWTHHCNYPCGENGPRKDLGEKHPEEIYPQFSEALHERFRDLCPYGEHGWHSVESVRISPAVEETVLL